MRGGEDMRRSGFKIMMGLIGLIKPLAGFMTLAIVLGVLGFLCAIGVSVLGVFGLGSIMGFLQTNLKTVFIIIAAFAILRGILHYGEQACNHYIAFKLLAIIRRQIFDALRKLAPAKMEGKKKGRTDRYSNFGYRTFGSVLRTYRVSHCNCSIDFADYDSDSIAISYNIRSDSLFGVFDCRLRFTYHVRQERCKAWSGIQTEVFGFKFKPVRQSERCGRNIAIRLQ